jgi:hypothetical protein
VISDERRKTGKQAGAQLARAGEKTTNKQEGGVNRARKNV